MIKLKLKFIWTFKVLKMDKAIMKKWNKDEELMLPNFKTYYKATAIRDIWVTQLVEHTIFGFSSGRDL